MSDTEKLPDWYAAPSDHEPSRNEREYEDIRTPLATLKTSQPGALVPEIDDLTDAIAAEFAKAGETAGEIITRFQNAESAAIRILGYAK